MVKKSNILQLMRLQPHAVCSKPDVQIILVIPLFTHFRVVPLTFPENSKLQTNKQANNKIKHVNSIKRQNHNHATERKKEILMLVVLDEP